MPVCCMLWVRGSSLSGWLPSTLALRRLMGAAPDFPFLYCCGQKQIVPLAGKLPAWCSGAHRRHFGVV